MKFVNLDRQYKRIKRNVLSRIENVLDSGQYIMGPDVGALEVTLSARTGVDHAICVSSGTDSLLISLMALNIKDGDEVITSPFSFIATAACIKLVGATPVYADISEKTFNIDPEKIENIVTSKTKAIIAVSLFGQCADFHRINEVAERYGLAVIEDAAQSFGSTYEAKPSCSLTTIATTSFYPSKPLGGYGDGGACFTDDSVLADRIRKIRIHGQVNRYEYDVLGVNGRLDAIQAAIILAKLEVFDEEIERRRTLAARYTGAFCDAGLDVGPFIGEQSNSTFSQFTVQVRNRDSIREKLNFLGVPTMIFYPTPLNKQHPVANSDSDCPVAERVCGQVISLPICPYMTDLEQGEVITNFLSVVKGTGNSVKSVSGG